MSGPPRFWTNERIIGAIQEWEAHYGAPPAESDWSHATPTTPSATTVHTHYPTWNAAIIAAGFEPRTTRLFWTKTLICQVAREFVKEHGRAPTPSDWDPAPLGAPSYGTVYYHYDSWAEMLAEAGIAMPIGRRWTKEAVAAAMLDHLGRTGKWPVSDSWKFAANDEVRPVHATVIRIFGSWTKAKRYAGWSGRCKQCDRPLGQKARGSQLFCSRPCRVTFHSLSRSAACSPASQASVRAERSVPGGSDGHAVSKQVAA